eukprot:scaffold21084_cov91-Isochrysis_galbana.AAC.2
MVGWREPSLVGSTPLTSCDAYWCSSNATWQSSIDTSIWQPRPVAARVDAGADVADGDADADGLRRPGGRAGHRHDPAQRLHRAIVRAHQPVGTRLAKAGDGRVAEPRVLLAEGLPPEPHPVHHTGPKVLDQHVRAREQRVQRLPVLWLLEVETDRLLTRVERFEIGRVTRRQPRTEVAGVVATDRVLHLDHACPQLAQQQRAVRPGQHPRQVDHGDVLQRPAARWRRRRGAGGRRQEARSVGTADERGVTRDRQLTDGSYAQCRQATYRHRAARLSNGRQTGRRRR